MKPVAAPLAPQAQGPAPREPASRAVAPTPRRPSVLANAPAVEERATELSQQAIVSALDSLLDAGATLTPNLAAAVARVARAKEETRGILEVAEKPLRDNQTRALVKAKFIPEDAGFAAALGEDERRLATVLGAVPKAFGGEKPALRAKEVAPALTQVAVLTAAGQLANPTLRQEIFEPLNALRGMSVYPGLIGQFVQLKLDALRAGGPITAKAARILEESPRGVDGVIASLVPEGAAAAVAGRRVAGLASPWAPQLLRMLAHAPMEVAARSGDSSSNQRADKGASLADVRAILAVANADLAGFATELVAALRTIVENPLPPPANVVTEIERVAGELANSGSAAVKGALPPLLNVLQPRVAARIWGTLVYDSDLVVSYASARALIETGGDEAFRLTRSQIDTGLLEGLLGAPRNVEVLRRGLAPLRLFEVARLGRSPASVRALATFGKDSTSELGVQVVRELDTLYETENGQTFLVQALNSEIERAALELAQSPDAQARAEIAKLLAKIRGPKAGEAREAWIKLATDPDPKVASTALFQVIDAVQKGTVDTTFALRTLGETVRTPSPDDNVGTARVLLLTILARALSAKQG